MVMISPLAMAWTWNARLPSGCCHILRMRHLSGGLPVSWTVIVWSLGEAGVEPVDPTWPQARAVTASTINTGPIQYDRTISGVSFPAHRATSRRTFRLSVPSLSAVAFSKMS